MAALPPLPGEGEDPWFEERNEFDLAVKRELEDRLSEEALDLRFMAANLGVTEALDRSQTAINDATLALQTAGSALQSSYTEYTVNNTQYIPPASDAVWSTDSPEWVSGEFVWRRTKNTYGNGFVEYTAPIVITGADGQAGEDAVLLRILSTKGTSFKNSAISTVLTVSVFKGTALIVNLTQLQATFGLGAYLEWYWRRIDDSDFGLISSADSRLSQGGFALTVSPADIDEQTVFQCNLVY